MENLGNTTELSDYLSERWTFLQVLRLCLPQPLDNIFSQGQIKALRSPKSPSRWPPQ